MPVANFDEGFKGDSTNNNKEGVAAKPVRMMKRKHYQMTTPFCELSATKVILKRAGHVSDASSSSSEDESDYEG